MNDEWLETTTGNRINKKTQIHGSNRILISGNTTICQNVLLQGDVPTKENVPLSIRIGKMCYLHEECQLLPPEGSGLTLGSYVIIGTKSKVMLKSIGSRVIVENNVTLSSGSVIEECCIIREGTIIPPLKKIPSYSEVLGIPGINFEVIPLHNSYRKLIELEAKQLRLLY